MDEIKLSIPTDIISEIFGEFDKNIKNIEQNFDVSIINRGDMVMVKGSDAEKAKTAIDALVNVVRNGQSLDEQNVNFIINEVSEDKEAFENSFEGVNNDLICLTAMGKPLRPKTFGQKKYIDAIRNNSVIFGVGPAGTGKTYLAMAMAITAFKNSEVSRIILTRPAIEAGENLGFLPGDLQQKVDPYLRPLYDALYEILGAESFNKNMERGLIEVAPLAYMRGRTLDNSFIVLDEAQNTTSAQMKMFLTRIGFGSKAVITGDDTQIDLPAGKKSGLVEATSILKGIEGISLCKLTNKDVVRHPLVKKIINAYESYENRKKQAK
ncbi:MAG: PhoH family protein [Firmicutes bacterium]|nr:PhoH family protein [Bacillota bacterium]